MRNKPLTRFVGLSLTTAEKYVKEKESENDLIQGTENPPHINTTRQLFHGSSNYPDLSCHAKKIRAWIRKGKLEAFDLPGWGGTAILPIASRGSEPDAGNDIVLRKSQSQLSTILFTG